MRLRRGRHETEGEEAKYWVDQETQASELAKPQMLGKRENHYYNDIGIHESSDGGSPSQALKVIDYQEDEPGARRDMTALIRLTCFSYVWKIRF